MQGAKDRGAYLEDLRTEHMRPGYCSLCKKWKRKLGNHHERYRPERKLPVCMDGKGNCHWRVHFEPWLLTDKEKELLLQCRHGKVQWAEFSKRPRLKEKLLKEYVAPGRRPAQLAVREEMRERAKAHV